MRFITCPSCSVNVPEKDDGKCVNCGSAIGVLSDKKRVSPADRLDEAATRKLADMIEGQRHPNRINAFLMGEGIAPEELDAVYDSYGVTEKRLRKRHREMRWMQFIGAMFLAIGLVFTIASWRAGWIVGAGILFIIVGLCLMFGSLATRPERVDR